MTVWNLQDFKKDIKKIKMKYKNHKVLGKQLVPETNKPNIVNINFILNGLHFDAAVDVNWEMHAYDEERYEEENWSKTTAIELYCFDKPDWDIKMIYQNKKNSTTHTVVDFDNIIEEIKEWIKQMSE